MKILFPLFQPHMFSLVISITWKTQSELLILSLELCMCSVPWLSSQPSLAAAGACLALPQSKKPTKQKKKCHPDHLPKIVKPGTGFTSCLKQPTNWQNVWGCNKGLWSLGEGQQTRGVPQSPLLLTSWRNFPQCWGKNLGGLLRLPEFGWHNQKYKMAKTWNRALKIEWGEDLHTDRTVGSVEGVL